MTHQPIITLILHLNDPCSLVVHLNDVH